MFSLLMLIEMNFILESRAAVLFRASQLPELIISAAAAAAAAVSSQVVRPQISESLPAQMAHSVSTVVPLLLVKFDVVRKRLIALYVNVFLANVAKDGLWMFEAQMEIQRFRVRIHFFAEKTDGRQRLCRAQVQRNPVDFLHVEITEARDAFRDKTSFHRANVSVFGSF